MAEAKKKLHDDLEELSKKREAEMERRMQYAAILYEFYPRLLDKFLNPLHGKASIAYDVLSSHPRLVIGALVAFNIASALYAPMDDCDEVFNYWEPLHYIWRGTGFQTWEYSPAFALRSYSVLSLFKVIAAALFAFSHSKVCRHTKLSDVYSQPLAICVLRDPSGHGALPCILPKALSEVLADLRAS